MEFDNGRSKVNSWEAIAVVWVKNGGGLGGVEAVY